MWYQKRRRRRVRASPAVLMVLAMVFAAYPSSALGQDATPTATATGGKTGATSEIAPELPPPDLPASNQQGYTFALKASLRADLQSVPKQAPVYKLVRSKPTQSDAQQLADRLRIGAQVQPQGDNGFAVSGNGQLFVSTDLIQYFSLATASQGRLPTDEEGIAYAREWLRLTGTLPPDLGAGRVANRTVDSGRVVVLFGPVEPPSVLAAYPSITVTLGPSGTILEASLRWAKIQRSDLYQLRPAKEAWKQVESGQAYLEVNLPAQDFPPGIEIKGAVSYTSISLAYSTAGPPGGLQYLEPIYVFRGRVRPEGKDKTYEVNAYVAALANSGAPVGLTPGRGSA